MKCELCKKNIELDIAEKIIGTYVKDKSGKLHTICSECQRKYKDKKSIINALVA